MLNFSVCVRAHTHTHIYMHIGSSKTQLFICQPTAVFYCFRCASVAALVRILTNTYVDIFLLYPRLLPGESSETQCKHPREKHKNIRPLAVEIEVVGTTRESD